MRNYDIKNAAALEAGLIAAQELKNLLYFGKLQKVAIINAKPNPYTGKMELGYTKDSPVGTSSIGTPVYSDLTLMGGFSYIDNTGEEIIFLNDRSRTSSASGGGDGGFYMNIETVLITLSQPIRIIKTEIQGRDGTVKEYIGKGDTVLNIKGIISGRNGVYPADEVARLKAWMDAPVSKGIVANWLTNLGIYNIVIESYDIPQTEGYYSQQIFTINAISDTPVELSVTAAVK